MADIKNQFMNELDQAHNEVEELEVEFYNKVSQAFREYMKKYNKLAQVKALNRLYGELYEGLYDEINLDSVLKRYYRSEDTEPCDLPLIMLLDPANDHKYCYDEPDITDEYFITKDEASALSHLANEKLDELKYKKTLTDVTLTERLLNISNGKFPYFVKIRD